MKLKDFLNKHKMNKLLNKLIKNGIKTVNDLHQFKLDDNNDNNDDDFKQCIISLKEYLNKYDNDLIEALKLSHCYQLLLKNKNRIEDNILDINVDENGSNFSVGERQLICLSRAIIRKSNILLLDEATSSVDKILDNLIQETIRKVFKNKTILTIAHRIDTILDYDRILIMDDGNVLEYDKPQILLNNKQSKFSQIVKESFGIDIKNIKSHLSISNNNKLLTASIQDSMVACV